MRRKLWLGLFAMFFTLAGVGCGHREAVPQAAAPAKLKVIASVYPVYDFVKQVGGDKVEVELLVPPGAEPHEWEPTPRDLTKIKAAKAIFFHGAGLESWTGKMLTKEILGSAIAVEISKGLDLLKSEDEEEPGGHEHKHEHGGTDPHVWLDPVLAQQEVKAVSAALASLDSANKDYYTANAERYIAELVKLDQEYQTGLKAAKRRVIVTNHAAFGYLAKRYDLKQQAVMGLSPDAEPTPDKMREVIKTVRENDVRYIFAETLLSSKLEETIARETGAKVLILHPLDQLTSQEMQSGQTYLSIMRSNLANLKTALSD